MAVPAEPEHAARPSRFIGRKTLANNAQPTDGSNPPPSTVQLVPAKKRTPARQIHQIPPSLLADADLLAAIALLPSNYDFEIPKTIHRIRSEHAQRIALQFPEGLLLFATTISDILARFCPSLSDTLILADVTYGACCVDDFSARALGCELLVHYAHSCLVPSGVTAVKTLYVFVEIGVEREHLLASVLANFEPPVAMALVATIQFNGALQWLARELRERGFRAECPQTAPLSKGELLGCTSPTFTSSGTGAGVGAESTADVDVLLYVGDGRFHLESAMIANPTLAAYRYDPYSRRLTHEQYAHVAMQAARSSAIARARAATRWGLILGTLGRQGNPHTLSMIEAELVRQGKPPVVTVLMSEIVPGRLALMGEVQVWVQVACPRLSIDWGGAFAVPLLTPYEALVALGVREGWEGGKGGGVYPMDYYAKGGLGRVGR